MKKITYKHKQKLQEIKILTERKREEKWEEEKVKIS